MSEAGGGLFYPDSPEDEREFQRCMENAQDREALPGPEKCADPDCDGLAGHAGPHYQWVPE